MRTRAKKLLRATFLVLTVAGVATAPLQAAQKEAEARVMLSVAPLLIDADGIHPLRGAAAKLHDAGQGGSFLQVVELDDAQKLLYHVEFSMPSTDTIDLRLEGSVGRKGAIRPIPEQKQRISLFESWTTDLWTDDDGKRTIRMWITPVFQTRSEDEPFTEQKLGMQVTGGPMILYRPGPGMPSSHNDRVAFREINVPGGRGLSVGVTEVGVFNLSVESFPGATACGWIRGTRLFGELDGHAFSIYSTRQILPDDPSRPEKGWTLYGKLEPVTVERGYYSGFDPKTPWRLPEWDLDEDD